MEYPTLEKIQDIFFDFSNYHKNKTTRQSKNISVDLFENTFLKHIEDIPVFNEFTVESKNNRVNYEDQRNFYDVEKFIQKDINRSKSYTFGKKILNNNINNETYEILQMTPPDKNLIRGVTPDFEEQYNFEEEEKKNEKTIDIGYKTDLKFTLTPKKERGKSQQNKNSKFEPPIKSKTILNSPKLERKSENSKSEIKKREPQKITKPENGVFRKLK